MLIIRVCHCHVQMDYPLDNHCINTMLSQCGGPYILIYTALCLVDLSCIEVNSGNV